MTELLFAIGIAVFFLTVYGAVMIGGHLLENLQIAGDEDMSDTRNPGRRSPVSPPPTS